MINELSLRIKHVEDISGERVADTHAKSILLTFIDPTTRQHTASFHCKTNDYSRLKQECLQFINNASGSGFSPMQLGSFVPSQGAPAQPEQWPQDSQSSGVGQVEWGEGYLHAFGKVVIPVAKNDISLASAQLRAKGNQRARASSTRASASSTRASEKGKAKVSEKAILGKAIPREKVKAMVGL